MVRRTQFEFVNAREQRLVGYEYLPGEPAVGGADSSSAGDASHFATLVWHHGVCEHSARYIPVLEHLANAGVAVYTFDAHGHGRSEPTAPGERCWIKRWRDLVDDLYTFVGSVEQRAGGRLPADTTFLGGQSMGALVAACAALQCQERWAGLVVFSGAMGVVWTPVLRVQALLSDVMVRLIPGTQLVPAVKPENLHPDGDVVQAFKDDPLIFKGDLRVQTGQQLLKAMNHLAAHRHELRLPLYAVHGTRDAVTSVSAVDAFVRGVSSTDVEFQQVEGGFHEMLMGPERAASADGMLAWMRRRAGTRWQGQQPDGGGGGGDGADGGGGAASKL